MTMGLKHETDLQLKPTCVCGNTKEIDLCLRLESDHDIENVISTVDPSGSCMLTASGSVESVPHGSSILLIPLYSKLRCIILFFQCQYITSIMI